MPKSKQEDVFEIETLNAESLDVRELERRFELSTAVPAEMGWTCDCDCACAEGCCDTLCGTHCPSDCTTYCGSDCTYLCSVDCGTDTCMILAPEPLPEEPV